MSALNCKGILQIRVVSGLLPTSDKADHGLRFPNSGHYATLEVTLIKHYEAALWNSYRYHDFIGCNYGNGLES
jgi:hypothetical protein